MEAVKPIFNCFSIPGALLLAAELIIVLVYFLRCVRQPGDARRMLLLGLVPELLAILVLLQNALVLPRILPDFFHRYLAILPFISAGMYFALMREVDLHRKKSAPAHYALGGASCLCALVSYLSI